ncbi:hypothetical protein AAW51_4083 [Caldimonas brevitalea]|uniref:Uncharacterized protein n=1 Tax=Caldimonas brevitalea TaxID=413882 RepID=A0A0G3BMW8_9BURK|nr:hypothetical protein AAW51_4083 [Caldimonas brevitalea]
MTVPLGAMPHRVLMSVMEAPQIMAVLSNLPKALSLTLAL